MSARSRLSRLSTVRPAIVCPPFVMSLCALSPLAIAAKLIVGVSAKAQTEATCILTQYSWVHFGHQSSLWTMSDRTGIFLFRQMTNSLRQSPCLVAAYLLGACNNGGKSLRGIPHSFVLIVHAFGRLGHCSFVKSDLLPRSQPE